MRFNGTVPKKNAATKIVLFIDEQSNNHQNNKFSKKPTNSGFPQEQMVVAAGLEPVTPAM